MLKIATSQIFEYEPFNFVAALRSVGEDLAAITVFLTIGVGLLTVLINDYKRLTGIVNYGADERVDGGVNAAG